MAKDRESFIWEEDELPEDQDYGNFSQFNVLPEDEQDVLEENKQDRKKFFSFFKREKKIKEKKVKEKKTKAKRQWKKKVALLVVLLLFLVIILYFIYPVYLVEDINVNQTTFITEEEIIKQSGLATGKNYSRLELYSAKSAISSPFIYSVSESYDQASSSVNLKVNEYKPLAIGADDTFYYSDGKKIMSSTTKSYPVPELIGFNETNQTLVLEQLQQLDYNVIKEITAIQYLESDSSDQLVVMQMADGNYVEININQIADKMDYYLQMETIIKSENGGKPGVIHLNLGDYYEPL